MAVVLLLEPYEGTVNSEYNDPYIITYHDRYNCFWTSTIYSEQSYPTNMITHLTSRSEKFKDE